MSEQNVIHENFHAKHSVFLAPDAQRDRHRERDRQTDRQAGRQAGRDRERHRERQREKQTETERERAHSVMYRDSTLLGIWGVHTQIELTVLHVQK